MFPLIQVQPSGASLDSQNEHEAAGVHGDGRALPQVPYPSSKEPFVIRFWLKALFVFINNVNANMKRDTNW